MAHSHTSLLYHIVFATKERRPWIEPAMADRLHAYLGGGVRAEGGTAIIINGTADHVHLLARLRQDKALSDIVRGLKALSSKWVHDTFPAHRRFAWQAGYGAFTVSESQTQRVRTYIEKQDAHHHRTTFDEEFAALLKAHGIAYDPKHLWT
ncbi:MAG: IS200/IS605 family transposase [Phycisphaerae bacterium]